MKVVILRGLPGSGKSTYVKRLRQENEGFQVEVFSTDYFFEVNGEYKFDPSKLGQAHGSCLLRFIHEIERRIDRKDFILVVDNTNVTTVEMAPYIAISQAFGAEIHIVDCKCTVNNSVIRNTHGVPESTVWHMADSWQGEECFPSHWPKQLTIETDCKKDEL